MKTLQFAGELALYIAGLMAVFEFLPPARRAAIDDSVNRTLSWRLLGTVIALAVSLHVSLRFFAYISPLFVFAVCIALWLGSKAVGFIVLDGGELGAGCLFSVVALLVAIIAAYAFAVPELQLFAGSLALTVTSAVFFALNQDSDFAQANLAITGLGFFFIALPSGIGHWSSPYAVDAMLSPYLWVTDTVEARTNWLLSSVVLPGPPGNKFTLSYLSAAQFIRECAPTFLVNFRPFVWFELSGVGYLILFAVLVQLLFVVYCWYLIKLFILLIFTPLIRLSNWLKNRFGIEQRRIPIAGILIGICASTFMLILKTIEYAA